MDEGGNVTDVLHLPDHSESSQNAPVVFVKVILALYWISIILILVGNVTVIVIVIKHKVLRTVTNMYIVSLCISDITVGIFTIPADIMSLYNEDFMSNAMCKVLEYVAYVALCSNIYCVLCISVDRYRATVKPFHGHKSKRQGFLFISVVWIFSCVYGIRAVFWYNMEKNLLFKDGAWVTDAHCVILPSPNLLPVLQGFIIVDLFVVYFVPLITMTVLHVIILRKANRSNGKVATSAYKNELSKKRQARMIRMLLLITLIFALCQMPENIYLVVRYIIGDFHGSFITKHICDFIMFSNSWLNVVVYVFCNDNFKKVIINFSRRNAIGTLVLKESKTMYPEESRKTKVKDSLRESKDRISPPLAVSGGTQSTSASKSGKTDPRVFVIAEMNRP